MLDLLKEEKGKKGSQTKMFVPVHSKLEHTESCGALPFIVSCLQLLGGQPLTQPGQTHY